MSAEQHSKAALKATASSESKPDSCDVSELATLREIVFGQAQQQLQSDIKNLERRLTDKLDTLQAKVLKQLNELQDRLEKSDNALAADLRQVDKKHEDAGAELQSYANKLSSELEMSDTSSRQDADELHNRIEKEVTQLSEKYDAKFVETLSKLEQVTQELSSSKTDRKTLAKLLATMAVNLESDES